MAKQVPLHITAGLPFAKTVVATLPTGRSWWTESTDFEVLSQIREAADYTSPLLLDLKQFLTVTFDDVDEITIELEMTGAETRRLTKAGHYDMLISDTLAVDGRAIRVVSGPVHRDVVVTSDTEVLTV